MILSCCGCEGRGAVQGVGITSQTLADNFGSRQQPSRTVPHWLVYSVWSSGGKESIYRPEAANYGTTPASRALRPDHYVNSNTNLPTFQGKLFPLIIERTFRRWNCWMKTSRVSTREWQRHRRQLKWRGVTSRNVHFSRGYLGWTLGTFITYPLLVS